MKCTIGVALAAALLATSAGAVTLNFGAQGAVLERVVEGQTLTYDGLGVTFKSGKKQLAIFDDLADGRESGLGVCKKFNATRNKCAGKKDRDNIDAGDTVTLMFDKVVNLSGMSFRGEKHFPVGAPPGELLSSNTLLINGAVYTFGDAIGSVFKKVSSITFGYGGAAPKPYYINSIEASPAPVPLPPAAALLAAGLGLLGFSARRRRARA